nr:MAG TPA: hypothetical protein [Caudoviricetes sp.]
MLVILSAFAFTHTHTHSRARALLVLLTGSSYWFLLTGFPPESVGGVLQNL